jgi:serine/threonine-protein kinase PknG
VLEGQYRVYGCLAHGGQGTIYLARDEAVDQWVVLKGLLGDGEDTGMATFLLREKAFLAELSHGSIVHIKNFVSHEGASYIVMEYVGGKSLRQILDERREPNGGLPTEQAIAYVLAVLPTFTYLHNRSLLYCDFTPDNLMQVGDQVKMIDLGAVSRLGDPSGGEYGTPGFLAPEVGEELPSVVSDLYSLGRTLAVLVLGPFPGHQRGLQYHLPDPSDHPVLARFDSLHRFLLKATAPYPDDRFQTAGEMDEQLLGVLREVVALKGMADVKAAPSNLFGLSSDAAVDDPLPPLAVDAGDPAAGFLSSLPSDSPSAVLRAIENGIAGGQVEDTDETRRRRAATLIALDDHATARTELKSLNHDDPWDWRTVWLFGASAMRNGDLAEARAAFDRCWLEVPGELAPKLASALVEERAGDVGKARALFEIVVTVEPGHVAAVRGLIRCCARLGDVDGVLRASSGVRPSQRAYVDVKVETFRTLMRMGEHSRAAAVREGLELDEVRGAQLDVEQLESELAVLSRGSFSGDDGHGRPADSRPLGGAPAERKLRRRLEDALRRLAHFTSTPLERRRPGPARAEYVTMIDRANKERPWTLR